jgi:hypothetical protein
MYISISSVAFDVRILSRYHRQTIFRSPNNGHGHRNGLKQGTVLCLSVTSDPANCTTYGRFLSMWNDNFWSIKPYFTSMQYITMKPSQICQLGCVRGILSRVRVAVVVCP